MRKNRSKSLKKKGGMSPDKLRNLEKIKEKREQFLLLKRKNNSDKITRYSLFPFSDEQNFNKKNTPELPILSGTDEEIKKGKKIMEDSFGVP